MVVTPAPRPPDLAFWAKQTPWSDPGEYVELIAEIEPTPAGVHEVVTNLIAHYRGHWDALPESTREDVNLMRVSSRLRRDQQRHPGLAVGAPRELAARTQGCCRDHTLLGLAILRHHGIPARSRVGFASYFVPGWHHDHVVIEYHDGGRWVRFDPELPDEWDGLPHPHDLARSPGAYETAAEVWLASRRNGLDLSRYGVDPNVPALSGAWFAQGEVLLELSHRFGVETLLWQGFGIMAGPDDDLHEDLVDEVAELLLQSDAGDGAAEARLFEMWRSDERLHAGERVRQEDPLGNRPKMVSLATAE